MDADPLDRAVDCAAHAMLRAAARTPDEHAEQAALQAFANAVRTAGGMTDDGGFMRLSVATLVVDEILSRGRELIESSLLPRLEERLGAEAAALAREEIERLFGELADWFRKRVNDRARQQ
jgi:hypothetical protein